MTEQKHRPEVAALAAEFADDVKRQIRYVMKALKDEVGKRYGAPTWDRIRDRVEDEVVDLVDDKVRYGLYERHPPFFRLHGHGSVADYVLRDWDEGEYWASYDLPDDDTDEEWTPTLPPHEGPGLLAYIEDAGDNTEDAGDDTEDAGDDTEDAASVDA